MSAFPSDVVFAKPFFSDSNPILLKNASTLSNKSLRKTKRGGLSREATELTIEGWSSDEDMTCTPTTRTNTSTDYHTDLESELDRRTSIFEGTICQKRYMQACKNLKIPPSDSIFTSLDHSIFVLAHRFPSDEEVFAIAVGICLNTTFSEIHFIENRLSTRNLLYLCAALWENEYVGILDFTGNPLDETSLEGIVDLVTESETLHTLTLSGTEIRDLQGSSIETIMDKCKNLTILSLPYNELGDDAMKHIATALVSNTKITTLDLSWNCIRTPGASLLNSALKVNRTLKVLNLRMNGIGTEGVNIFAEMLTANNRTLKDLDISNNRIYDKGIGYVANMLSKNKSLVRLSVGNNPVSTAGINMVIGGVCSNTNSSLEILELHGLYANKETTHLIEKMNKVRKSLKIEFHGSVKKGTDVAEREGTVGVVHMDPMEMLRYYTEKTGSRLIDVFKFLDKHNNNILNRIDFVLGLEEMNLPFTDSQLDDLMDYLDPQGSGQINFSQLVEGDHQTRMKLRKRKEMIKRKAAEEAKGGRKSES